MLGHIIIPSEPARTTRSKCRTGWFGSSGGPRRERERERTRACVANQDPVGRTLPVKAQPVVEFTNTKQGSGGGGGAHKNDRVLYTATRSTILSSVNHHDLCVRVYAHTTTMIIIRREVYCCSRGHCRCS